MKVLGFCKALTGQKGSQKNVWYICHNVRVVRQIFHLYIHEVSASLKDVFCVIHISRAAIELLNSSSWGIGRAEKVLNLLAQFSFHYIERHTFQKLLGKRTTKIFDLSFQGRIYKCQKSRYHVPPMPMPKKSCWDEYEGLFISNFFATFRRSKFHWRDPTHSSKAHEIMKL